MLGMGPGLQTARQALCQWAIPPALSNVSVCGCLVFISVSYYLSNNTSDEVTILCFLLKANGTSPQKNTNICTILSTNLCLMIKTRIYAQFIEKVGRNPIYEKGRLFSTKYLWSSRTYTKCSIIYFTPY